jgi:outer membrane protein assembly factor BamB
VALVGLVIVAIVVRTDSDDDSADEAAVARTTTSTAPTTTTSTASTVPPLPPYDGWVDPASVGRPYGTVEGSTTFRGNPTRTYYGRGPVPTDPMVKWVFPGDGSTLCSESTVGGETTQWCGTGWTGQPAVFDRDGRRWVVFGSYAPAVHFLDADSGAQILPDFPVSDLIKGSVTIDPDGYPLVYFGSRDGKFRIVSFDGLEARELWSLAADEVSPTLWNDDWDGVGLVLDDYLFEGGENSQLHIVKLNRGVGPEGEVTVDPELVFNAPGWDDELLAAVGDQNVSIESSIAISGNTLYFANSGGLVQGWDITGLAEGIDPERTFRYWAGDDVDATVVVDEDGFLYVGVEYERGNSRSLEVGQLIKLDPSLPEDPLVWSVPAQTRLPDGVWATPAIHEDLVVAPTNEGFLKGVDRETGAVRWEKKLQGPVWSSPVVVDDVLIQADCEGLIHAYDLSDTAIDPPELWRFALPWCIESTPTVLDGVIYVGHRRGEFWAISDKMGE